MPINGKFEYGKSGIKNKIEENNAKNKQTTAKGFIVPDNRRCSNKLIHQNVITHMVLCCMDLCELFMTTLSSKRTFGSAVQWVRTMPL